MAFSKLFFVCSAAILCLFICSMSVSGANALDEGHHLGRREVHGHGGLAKRKRTSTTKKSSGSDRRRAKKRSGGGRCAVTPIANATSSLSSSASSASVHSSSSVPPPPSPSPTPSPSPAPAPAPPPPPPPVSSTSPAAAPPPSTAPSSGPAKGCLAWDDSFDTLSSFVTPKISKYYTWSEFGNGNVPGNGGTAEFVPMLSDGSQATLQAFNQQVPLSSKPPVVMGYNEINQAGQSNFPSGTAACQAWIEQIQPYAAAGAETVSPSCSSASNAVQYYEDFFNACAGYRIDKMAVHWYGTDAQDFITYIESLHSQFGKQMWVTEFGITTFGGGSQPSAEATEAALAQMIEYMDGADYIEYYCVFGTLPTSAMNGVNQAMQMMDSNNEPNSLGYQYIYDSW